MISRMLPVSSLESDASSERSIDNYNIQERSDHLELRAKGEYLLRSIPEFRRIRTGSGTVLHKIRSENHELGGPSFLSPKRWIKLPKGIRGRDVAKNPFEDSYQIEYSVLANFPQGYPIMNESDLSEFSLQLLLKDDIQPERGESPENYVSETQFKSMVSEITLGVENDPQLKPQRISQGSSGSYFIYEKVHGMHGYKIQKKGIFKPKDEEPYGPLSPKWSKWLHRTFFPCFFGRSCLIPNLGYISEAAACVLDRMLLSYIVPYTDIIFLESNAFYLSFWQRTRHKLSKKIGSFQVFLHGYEEAQTFLSRYPIPDYFEGLPENTTHLKQNTAHSYDFYWSKSLLDQFQEELEKLVILDYLMRNTDRGADNWMIKVEWIESKSNRNTVGASIKIGAIDSGLAFPWKHPNEWRLFPYGWLFLPYSIIGRYFSNRTRNHYLPLLTSKYWWEQTVARLKNVFKQDTEFNGRMWRKQIAVLKGQAFNVIEALKAPNSGPLELTRRENLLIWDDSMTIPSGLNNSSVSEAIQSSIYEIPSAPKAVHDPRITEATSLLHSDAQLFFTDDGAQRQMSGFDYNMSKFDTPKSFNDSDGVNTKTVVIERLEKVQGKRPVFTWC